MAEEGMVMRAEGKNPFQRARTPSPRAMRTMASWKVVRGEQELKASYKGAREVLWVRGGQLTLRLDARFDDVEGGN